MNNYYNSNEYRLFWEKLNKGEYDLGEYNRIGKGGKEIWIHASYKPIFCVEGECTLFYLWKSLHILANGLFGVFCLVRLRNTTI